MSAAISGSFQAAAAPVPLCLSSTFIQPDNCAFGGWDAANWGSYLGVLKEIGFRQIILHWTWFGGFQFNQIPAFMQAAESSGLNVIIGLASMPDNRIYDPAPVTVQAYLNEVAGQSNTLIESFTSAGYHTKSFFQGWYISSEVNDVAVASNNGNSRSYNNGRAELWANHYRSVCLFIKEKCGLPRQNVFTSLYIGQGQHLPPSNMGDFCKLAWQTVRHDVHFSILIQDARGTYNLADCNPANCEPGGPSPCSCAIEPYVKAIDGVREAGDGLGLTLELFGCATLARVKRQMQLAVKLRTEFREQFNRSLHISSFCASHHFFEGGNGYAMEMTRLGRDYENYCQSLGNPSCMSPV